MIQKGIVLGHVVLKRAIEVKKVKVEVIECLLAPNYVKGIQSFLGHVGFYRCFIKDFSKTTKPLTFLLAKIHHSSFLMRVLRLFTRSKRLSISPLLFNHKIEVFPSKFCVMLVNIQ